MSDNTKILIFAGLGQLSFHILDEKFTRNFAKDLAINIKT
jgi:hypothetical protein